METEDKDRIANLGELATVLAHEMKNPMNSIIINLEVLRSTVSELAQSKESLGLSRAQRCLEVIEGEVRRLDKVLRGFLDFANPPPSTKVRFKINPVIKVIVSFMAEEFHLKSVELEMHLDRDLPEIVGSADQFKQVLLNILINSLQSMPPQGGKVQIKTSKEADRVIMEVSDNGRGIDPAIRARIFDPYFTTKTRGSGLGLSIVKRFVKDHGGDIEVESELGKGSLFRISLPSQPLL